MRANNGVDVEIVEALPVLLEQRANRGFFLRRRRLRGGDRRDWSRGGRSRGGGRLLFSHTAAFGGGGVEPDFSGQEGAGRIDIASAVGGKFQEGSRPWELDCDIAIPAATQNELGEADARSLVDAGVKAIVEAANMPLTDEAEEIFDEAGVAIAPGKAANAGGVAISGLEMSQNRLGRSWSKGRMDKELREIMSQIFERTRQYGEFEGSIHYRRGADLAGFDRVAKAVSSFGIM